jgi:hypothetical protein
MYYGGVRSFDDGATRMDELDYELWHACAGPLTSLPPVESLVMYWPQGHIEQVGVCVRWWYLKVHGWFLLQFRLEEWLVGERACVVLVLTRSSTGVGQVVACTPDSASAADIYEASKHFKLPPHLLCKISKIELQVSVIVLGADRGCVRSCFPWILSRSFLS